MNLQITDCLSMCLKKCLLHSLKRQKGRQKHKIKKKPKQPRNPCLSRAEKKNPLFLLTFLRKVTQTEENAINFSVLPTGITSRNSLICLLWRQTSCMWMAHWWHWGHCVNTSALCSAGPIYHLGLDIAQNPSWAGSLDGHQCRNACNQGRGAVTQV